MRRWNEFLVLNFGLRELVLAISLRPTIFSALSKS